MTPKRAVDPTRRVLGVAAFLSQHFALLPNVVQLVVENVVNRLEKLIQVFNKTSRSSIDDISVMP
jgi:hypothetical protein